MKKKKKEKKRKTTEKSDYAMRVIGWWPLIVSLIERKLFGCFVDG